MAGSLNKVQLIGNLGKDPEIRHTKDGRPVANFSVATSESWRDRDTGEKKERVEWHNVVIFSEGLAKVAEQFLKKGSKVFLEGELQTRKWQDQQGNDRWSTEVVLQSFNAQLIMLDGKRDDGSRYDPEARGLDPDRAAGRNSYADAKAGVAGQQSSLREELNDDVPF